MAATIKVTTPTGQFQLVCVVIMESPLPVPDLTTMIDVKCSTENQFQLVCMVMLNQPPSAPRASRWRRNPYTIVIESSLSVKAAYFS